MDFDNIPQFNTANVDVIGIATAIDFPSGQAEESADTKRSVLTLTDEKGRKLEAVPSLPFTFRRCGEAWALMLTAATSRWWLLSRSR